MNIKDKSQSTPIPFFHSLIQFLGLIHFFSSFPDIVPSSFLQWLHGRRFYAWYKILTMMGVMVGGYWIWTEGVKIWKFVLLKSHPATIWGVGLISIFIGFALFHRISITWRRLRGVEVHILSRGRHYFALLGLPDEIVFQWLHPLLILSIAVWIPDGIVQVFLVMAAISIFVRVSVDNFFLQRHLDDFSAGTIEGKELKRPDSTEAGDGSTIVSTSEDMSQDDPSTVDDSYNSLPEHLQNIIYRSETQ